MTLGTADCTAGFDISSFNILANVAHPLQEAAVEQVLELEEDHLEEGHLRLRTKIQAAFPTTCLLLLQPSSH